MHESSTTWHDDDESPLGGISSGIELGRSDDDQADADEPCSCSRTGSGDVEVTTWPVVYSLSCRLPVAYAAFVRWTSSFHREPLVAPQSNRA